MKEYLRTTRSPWCSYLFALPLLLLYQAVVLAANLGQQRVVLNGADAMVQRFLSFLGVNGWMASWVVVALVAGVLTYRLDAEHRKSKLRKDYFWGVLAESAIYAAIFGSVVSLLTALVLPGVVGLQLGGGALNFGQKLATSLGAGLYEELVFRLFLTGGLLWLFSKFGWKPAAAVSGSVLIASFLFSLVHYLGPYADNWQLTSFTFRFVAGVVLAGLFALRGFAVAAWTHALYDVFLLLGGKG